MKTRLFIQILILIIVALLGMGALFRFEALTPTRPGGLYKVDKLTGRVWVVEPEGIRKLGHIAEAVKPDALYLSKEEQRLLFNTLLKLKGLNPADYDLFRLSNEERRELLDRLVRSLEKETP